MSYPEGSTTSSPLADTRPSRGKPSPGTARAALGPAIRGAMPNRADARPGRHRRGWRQLADRSAQAPVSGPARPGPLGLPEILHRLPVVRPLKGALDDHDAAVGFLQRDGEARLDVQDAPDGRGVVALVGGVARRPGGRRRVDPV